MNAYIKTAIPVSLILIFLLNSCIQKENTFSDFSAYYTSYGEADDITGPYADIVVRFPDGKKLVFCRTSSYLPFLENNGQKWFMQELIPRNGDGEGLRPDKYNRYSYVRIIKNTPEEVIVHWRYIPDFEDPGFTGVVHESYVIKPDGKVKRTVQPGNMRSDEFTNPENWFVEELALEQSSIKQLAFSKPVPRKSPLPAIKGTPVITESVTKPLLWWTFDDGLHNRAFDQKDVTIEKVQGIPCTIGGNISLFKKGVSGTALAFDGYYSNVSLEDAAPPDEPQSYSLEAWIALDAYPWKAGAVLDMTEDNGGVYLGISDVGQLIFKIFGKNKTHTLTSKKEIALYRWTYVAATYNLNQNLASIYIDGINAGELTLGEDQLNLKKTDISIGLNKTPMRATQHVSRDYPPEVRTPEGNQPSIYGIEGLIDEVKIYNRYLTSAQVRKSFQLLTNNTAQLPQAELEPRVLPGEVDGKNAAQFGASYKKLHYHDLWDNLWRSSEWPDIVVRFDELPCNVVYWRGPNYGPGWVTENNTWMCDQSSEIGTFYGCAEHMADKQNRFSHVRLLENTEARVVVHWRYASADIMYKFDNYKTWTDEYHYIYPDGSAVRDVHYHDGEVGWQDVQFFAEPGSTPEDKIHLQALTVANLSGETYKMDWSRGVPENRLENASVSLINFKSEYKVFVIYPDGSEIGAWGERERATPETHFAGPWNHWPVSQIPNDGRYAMKTDRVTHSALGGASPESFAMYGFTNQDISSLVPLARFWNYPPELEISSGAALLGYSQSQKAYLIKAEGKNILMTIHANEKSPLKNPCFVINGAEINDIQLHINSQAIQHGKDFRYGFIPTAEGHDLIVWVRILSEKPVSLEIKL